MESERLELQRYFDSQISLDERNRKGQYSTPPALAAQILKYVLQLRENYCTKNAIDFLEPAIGTGVFYSILRQLTKDDFNSAVGIEVDNKLCEISKGIWSSSNIEIENADFTRENPANYGQFNLLVTNPPYVRHHYIYPTQKKELRACIQKRLNYTVSGLSSLYLYFILIAHDWLTDNALAIWLIPSEFMDVNYGKILKQYLITDVTLKRIHKFNPEDLQFSDALVTSSILIYQKKLPQKNDIVSFTFGGSIDNPDKVFEIPIEELDFREKWGNIIVKKSQKRNELVLSDLFDIKRGIATGNNSFFILPLDYVKNQNLPLNCFKPILPSPRSLDCDIIDGNEGGFPKVPNSLVVLDTDIPEKEIERNYPTLWSYLTSGKEKGVLKGYLVKNRKLWYKQENREPAPFLCTYMGRMKVNKHPFRFIFNKSKAIATNVYILLYPKHNINYFLTDDDKFMKLFNFLQNIDADEFCLNGRGYGGGLKKVEPNELGKISVANILDIFPDLKV